MPISTRMQHVEVTHTPVRLLKSKAHGLTDYRYKGQGMSRVDEPQVHRTRNVLEVESTDTDSGGRTVQRPIRVEWAMAGRTYWNAVKRFIEIETIDHNIGGKRVAQNRMSKLLARKRA